MSKSVRDYTSFAGATNSRAGMTRQNVRLSTLGILRFSLLCSVLFAVFTADIVAQPPLPPYSPWSQLVNLGNWPGPGANPPVPPGQAWPINYIYGYEDPPTDTIPIYGLFENINNAIQYGGWRYTTSSVTFRDAGGLQGSNGAEWWVYGSLSHGGSNAISNLTYLRVGYNDVLMGGLMQSNLSVSGAGGVNVTNTIVTGNLSVTGAGGLSSGYISIGGNASTTGTGGITGNNTFFVGGTLTVGNNGSPPAEGWVRNFSLLDATQLVTVYSVGTITGVSTIIASNGFYNWGDVLNFSYLNVSGSYADSYIGGALINGTNSGTRSRGDARLRGYDINVVGDFTQYFDGSTRSSSGYMDVTGRLYNAGEIRIHDGTETDYPSYYIGTWTITAESLFNDGRLWSQLESGDIWSGNNQAWGIIYDADLIDTTKDLVNTGVNAVIDGMVNSGLGKYMHVGGDLKNLERAAIFNYGDIIVHGNFLNRGATLAGGHWGYHLTDGNPLYEVGGYIGIWGNVINTVEEEVTSGRPLYGGLIASFDKFDIHGSVINDAYSTITGNYTEWIDSGLVDGDGVPILIESGIFGRRANIQNGVLIEGEFDDHSSILNIAGVFGFSDKEAEHDHFATGNPITPLFYGLYNEGYIGEIDIISVGSSESAVLWNALHQKPFDSRVQLAYDSPSNPNNNVTPNPNSTIYDIGVLNLTNLINEGTIREIDIAINVSYSLVNTETGSIDGLSTFHTEWFYDVDSSTGTGFGVGTMVTIDEVMRSNLRVGKSVSGYLNPLSQYLGMDVTDLGIINFGTITNFDTITSLGHMYNFGQIGAPVQTNAGLQGGVTALAVGSNMDTFSRANLYNFGALMNIDGVTVSGDLFLEAGSSFSNVGTVTARTDITIDANINGGFRVLSARDGDLIVTGGWQIDPITNKRVVDTDGLPVLDPNSSSLVIERGSVATGNTSVQNYGFIVNNGLLSSAAGVDNRGIIVNDGMISAYNLFLNRGLLQGNGMISLAPNGVFQNAADGVINGGVTINGNFQNYNGTIILTAANDIIRVTNGGTATIAGGIVDAQIANPVVGKQYMFIAADNPGNLYVSQELRGLGSGDTGSVLDFAPIYGHWDGTKYVAGKEWSKNQYYWLEVQRAYSYGAHAVTPNQIAIGNYLDSIGSTPKQNSALWNMLVQLDAISDDPTNPYFAPGYREHQGQINPAALKALEQLSGIGYANLGVASVHNIGVINRSLADVLRSDVFKFSMVGNPNNAIRGQAIAPLRYNRWGTLFGIGGTAQQDNDGVSGYRQSFGGLMAGFDRAFWTGTRLGGYVSAATGDISMKQVNESADVTNVMVGMYLRQEMYFGYWLASAGFGIDNYKMERNLTMIGHRAESKFTANIGTAYLERGIDIPVYYATFQPYANFQAVAVQQDKFTERMWNQNGQYTNIGLEGVEGKTNSLRMAIGARSSSMPVILPWGQLAMTTNMAWYHEFCNDKDRTFVARFANPGGSNFGTTLSDTTFTVRGNNPKQDWFNFGFGLNVDRNSTRFFLGADLFANSQQTMFSGNGGFVTVW